MSPNPQLISPKNASVDATPSAHGPVIGESVIDGEFVFDSCVDVHIGPKYEHSSNIVINQNISVSGEGELPPEFQTVLKEELKNSTYGTLHYKYSTNWCCLQFWPITITAAISLLAIVIAVIILMLTINTNEHTSAHTPENESPLSTPIVQLSDDYPTSSKFVSREIWGAAPPQGNVTDNVLPVERVIFIHTVRAGTCNTFLACKEYVRNVQEMHMKRFGDIGYNFVIGSDGYIYVGVGWDKVGAHTKGYNTGSLGVAFIGDFRTDEPNENMLSSAKELLKIGIKRTKLGENCQVFGHCQITISFPYSPGENILKHIKTWDHWNNTNLDQCAG